MFIQQDLARLWRQTVASGSIANRFSDRDGREVEIGLRLVDDRIEHYAKYLESGEFIGASIDERLLPGSDFSIEWNQYRALKPHIRVTQPGRQPEISAQVERCLFACQDPSHPLTILTREPLMQLALPCAKWTAFYNAVPVEPRGHFLWIPVQAAGVHNTYPHKLQVLDRALVEDFVALGLATSGAATFYNSLHAGASVNHIHYHSVHDGRTAPLKKAAIRSSHGYRFLHNYPATGLVFDARGSEERLWVVIEKLQANQVPLNIIFVDERVFVFPRSLQHEAVSDFPDGVMACAELSGKLITTREDYFNGVAWEQVQQAFAKTCLSDEEIIKLLES